MQLSRVCYAPHPCRRGGVPAIAQETFLPLPIVPGRDLACYRSEQFDPLKLPGCLSRKDKPEPVLHSDQSAGKAQLSSGEALSQFLEGSTDTPTETHATGLRSIRHDLESGDRLSVRKSLRLRQLLHARTESAFRRPTNALPTQESAFV